MRGSVNRFIAYLLLLLLPLQSQAAVGGLACNLEMKYAVMVEYAMEDCHGGSMLQPVMLNAYDPDTKPHPEPSLASHSVPCGMSSSCLALTSIAVLRDTPIVLIDPPSLSLAVTDEFYLSCIPEGPERPPRHIRA